MRASPSIVPHRADQDIYLVLDDFGRLGRAWRVIDEQNADRETLIGDVMAGQYSHPVRIVAFNTAEGWSRDVTAEIAEELRQRCPDKGHVPTSVQEFLDEHSSRFLPAPRCFPYEVQNAPPIRPEHGKSGLQSGTMSKTNVIDNHQSRSIALPAARGMERDVSCNVSLGPDWWKSHRPNAQSAKSSAIIRLSSPEMTGSITPAAIIRVAAGVKPRTRCPRDDPARRR